MKKLLVAFLTTILLSPIFTIAINAEVLGDPNDILTVVTPSPNQKVSGTINVTWYMYDNNQNVIPYKLNLYDSSTCRTTNFGQINSTANGVSSTTQLNSYSWNTRSTLSTANLVDGNYCLKICLAMKNGSGDYSACNARFVKIVNNNRAPVITSIPTNLLIKESESWSYLLKATDPDGDPVSYRFVQTVPFLTINQQTGQISTNNVSKTLPAGVNRADYNIIVAADDNFAGSVTQQFTLSVIKDSSVGTPPPVTTPISTPNGSVINKPSQINFTAPKEGEQFSGAENKITWDASDVDGIESLTIQYSKDLDTWKDIAKFDGPNVPNNYVWDVTEIEDGEYYLQIIVKDKLGNEVKRISKKFKISNDLTGPNQENNPLIINVRPQNNSETADRKPQISGDFVPADNAEISPETFEIKLNDQADLLECQHDAKGFSCVPKSDLLNGLNKVTASIKDSSDRGVIVEWSFTIGDGSPISSPVIDSGNSETVIILGREVPRNTFNIILTVCCIAGLLILIPWILYLLWSGRRKEVVETKTEIFDYNTVPTETTTTTTETSSIGPSDNSSYYTPENYSHTSYNYTPEPVKTETTTTTEIIPAEPVVEQPTEVVTETPVETTIVETPIEAPVTETPVENKPENQTLVDTDKPIEEPKVEERKDDTQITTNNYTIDDYYSYVNPSASVTPEPTSPDALKNNGEKKDEYVEPTETS